MIKDSPRILRNLTAKFRGNTAKQIQFKEEFKWWKRENLSEVPTAVIERN